MTDDRADQAVEAEAAAAGEVETRGFESEVTQLLDLMIHSLYSNREIYLRELISNAADAIDKLKFAALTNDSLYEGEGDLKVFIDFDKEGRSMTIQDNGIGMNRSEVIENLGTIAKSGTKQFFEKLTGDEAKDARLIGQFGVGFYSAFIVADEVVVETRRAGDPPSAGVRWVSAGKGQFTVETITREARGTTIQLKLKEDASEFADAYRLRGIVKRYSEHLDVPIFMPAIPSDVAEDDDTAQPADAPERINEAEALWLKAKNDISDDDYKAFYKQVTHDFEDPLEWVHAKVEGTLEYTSLLYIPKNAPFDMWDRDAQKGLKLYVQRVFIMEDEGDLLPRYLRFVRGIIDTNDLPLNVSREILQKNKTIDSIRAASIKKVLGLLESLAKDDEKYQGFWQTFGKVLKEGIVEDHTNQERVAKLARFRSTQDANAETETVSLEDYRSRMAEDQKAIYYLTGDDLAATRTSPLLEVFKQREIEVLLLTDPVDEWLVTHLTNFDDCELKSVAHGEIDLGDAEANADDDLAGDEQALLERIAKLLEAEVDAVRSSSRLVDSPACLVANEAGMSNHLEQMLRAAGQAVPESKPVLEVNLAHPLVKQLASRPDGGEFNDWTTLIYEQAVLSDGRKLSDPSGFARRLNDLMLKAALTT